MHLTQTSAGYVSLRVLAAGESRNEHVPTGVSERQIFNTPKGQAGGEKERSEGEQAGKRIKTKPVKEL